LKSNRLRLGKEKSRKVSESRVLRRKLDARINRRSLILIRDRSICGARAFGPSKDFGGEKED